MANIRAIVGKGSGEHVIDYSVGDKVHVPNSQDTEGYYVTSILDFEHAYFVRVGRKGAIVDHVYAQIPAHNVGLVLYEVDAQ